MVVGHGVTPRGAHVPWQARRRTIARLTAQIVQLQRAQAADPAWLPGVVDELLAAAEPYLEADRSRAARDEYLGLARKIRLLLAQRPRDVETIIDVATWLAAGAELNVAELLENYSAVTCRTERRIP